MDSDMGFILNVIVWLDLTWLENIQRNSIRKTSLISKKHIILFRIMENVKQENFFPFAQGAHYQ